VCGVVLDHHPFVRGHRLQAAGCIILITANDSGLAVSCALHLPLEFEVKLLIIILKAGEEPSVRASCSKTARGMRDEEDNEPEQ